ncbi:MAG: serine/threonine-protein kinase [Phycisphaerae bacterium]
MKKVKADQINEQLAEELLAQGVGSEARSGGVAGSNSGLTPKPGNRLQAPDEVDASDQEAKPRAASLTHRPRSNSACEEDWAFFREALPEYDVKERIHYGGQGVVYRAVHRAAKRPVAIKVLLDGPLASERQRQRLAREMELVARLQHPDIVTLYEAGEVRGRPFLVMEFVDGLPIGDYVLLNDLSVRQIVQLFARVCRAVSSAHESGVIHRDIKPANILVDADGKPSVLDFGLGRDVSGDDDAKNVQAISQTGQVVGTLPYLSPEQASGMSKAIDLRSDIYSLGVLLFELITGRFPYPMDGSPDAVRDNIVSREPIPLRKALGRNTCDRPGALSDVNDDLEKIVLKALEKQKERRYHSAASFADDLDRYLAGDAVEAKSASSFYVFRKSIRRLRLPIAVGMVIAVVATAATVFVAAERIRTKTVAELAESGLQMGGLIRLGSARQGEGQLDQAIALFESAIEVGKTVPRDDPVVLRYRYGAIHRLAELYFETGDPEKAERYVKAGIDLAADVVSEDPRSLEWLRLLGFSYRLAGRRAYASDNWEEALVAYDKGASIRADLLALYPDNRSLKSELASMLALRGQSLRKLRRYDEALKDLERAYDIHRELAQLEPEVVDHLVELSRTELRIGILYLCRKTEADDQAAAGWLKLAAHRLIALQDSGESKTQEWRIGEILESIGKNQELVRGRAERRSKRSD